MAVLSCNLNAYELLMGWWGSKNVIPFPELLLLQEMVGKTVHHW
jgi:hypothetical protein